MNVVMLSFVLTLPFLSDRRFSRCDFRQQSRKTTQHRSRRKRLAPPEIPPMTRGLERSTVSWSPSKVTERGGGDGGDGGGGVYGGDGAMARGGDGGDGGNGGGGGSVRRATLVPAGWFCVSGACKTIEPKLAIIPVSLPMVTRTPGARPH